MFCQVIQIIQKVNRDIKKVEQNVQSLSENEGFCTLWKGKPLGRETKDKSVGVFSTCFYHVFPQMCKDTENKSKVRTEAEITATYNSDGLLCKTSMTICL